MSNFWKAYAGVTLEATDELEVELRVTHLEAVEPFDLPAYVTLGSFRIPVAPVLSFWDVEADDDLGWQAACYAYYEYSEDLSFEAGYVHYFVGDGIGDGSFLDENGFWFFGGRDDEDADYVYVQTSVFF
jgi:hypothetical protein